MDIAGELDLSGMDFDGADLFALKRSQVFVGDELSGHKTSVVCQQNRIWILTNFFFELFLLGCRFAVSPNDKGCLQQKTCGESP
ncbi:hypothetical protein THH46_07075 [Pseudomonas sp. NA13]